jgi:hypothetical protein
MRRLLLCIFEENSVTIVREGRHSEPRLAGKETAGQ